LKNLPIAKIHKRPSAISYGGEILGEIRTRMRSLLLPGIRDIKRTKTISIYKDKAALGAALTFLEDTGGLNLAEPQTSAWADFLARLGTRIYPDILTMPVSSLMISAAWDLIFI
jgi:hypothetical protein